MRLSHRFSNLNKDHTMKTRLLPYLILLKLSTPNVQADTVLSPFELPNSGTAAPFFVTTDSAESVRYQQVYGSSDFQFQGHGASAFLVSGMSFTASSGGGPNRSYHSEPSD